MKIHIYELCMTGTNHIYFNSAMLNMVVGIFGCKIIFYGEKTHLELVSSLIDYNNIEYRPIKISNYLGPRILLSDFNDLIKFWKTRKDRRSKDDIILILNRLPFTMLFINILNRFEKRKVINVLHGELEYLVNKNLRGLTRYYYKIFKLAYKLSTPNNTYIFLGDSIKETVIERGIRFPRAKLITIDHPYNYNAQKNTNNLSEKEIYVSNIGTAAVRKNSQLMIELKSKLNNRNFKIKLAVLGTVEESLQKEFENAGIQYNNAKASKEVYETQIATTDYSLSFFTNEMNIALASGSFFDCIKFAKPILALKGNPFVDYYFDKLGNIGYRFDTIDEMADFLGELDESENKHYIDQVKNLEKAQETLSLDNIGNQLKKQLVI